jgi:hypothetical protein
MFGTELATKIFRVLSENGKIENYDSNFMTMYYLDIQDNTVNMYVCSWMDSMPALYGSWTPDEFIEWFAEQDDDSMYNLNEAFLRELIIENSV